MRRVVAKLGSSVVADSDGSPRMDVLASVCGMLAAVHEQGGEVIVVTSGAIARGMRVIAGCAEKLGGEEMRELRARQAAVLSFAPVSQP